MNSRILIKVKRLASNPGQYDGGSFFLNSTTFLLRDSHTNRIRTDFGGYLPTSWVARVRISGNVTVLINIFMYRDLSSHWIFSFLGHISSSDGIFYKLTVTLVNHRWFNTRLIPNEAIDEEKSSTLSSTLSLVCTPVSHIKSVELITRV